MIFFALYYQYAHGIIRRENVVFTVSLRIVRHLPTNANSSRRDPWHWAGVVQASREETASKSSAVRVELVLWGFECPNGG